MHATLELIRQAKIVPILVIDDATLAPGVIRALQAGGIRCAEITLRTAAGIASIEATAQTSEFVVGAGTVLSTADVHACFNAGAKFIVSPGFDKTVVEYATRLGLAVLPGIATASEILAAKGAGLEAVKLFPASQAGGIDAIEAFAGPFPEVAFMPSGGVGPHNAREYLEHPSVFAISGSWMAQKQVIATGDFERITRVSAEAMALI